MYDEPLIKQLVAQDLYTSHFIQFDDDTISPSGNRNVFAGIRNCANDFEQETNNREQNKMKQAQND